MRRLITVIGMTLGCGAFSLVGVGQQVSGALSEVDRV